MEVLGYNAKSLMFGANGIVHSKLVGSFFVRAVYMTPWNLKPVIRMEEYLAPMNNDETLWNGSVFDGKRQ
ncbi:MAG: hypothetical protein J5I98_07500 [Phaeodactylibacter sp.]|nr:hypothetical protein [Phaeodactylibacter sp.]